MKLIFLIPVYLYILKNRCAFFSQELNLKLDNRLTVVKTRINLLVLAFNQFNQMLQTEPFLFVVVNEITCMITVLLISMFLH